MIIARAEQYLLSTSRLVSRWLNASTWWACASSSPAWCRGCADATSVRGSSSFLPLLYLFKKESSLHYLYTISFPHYTTIIKAPWLLLLTRSCCKYPRENVIWWAVTRGVSRSDYIVYVCACVRRCVRVCSCQQQIAVGCWIIGNFFFSSQI